MVDRKIECASNRKVWENIRKKSFNSVRVALVWDRFKENLEATKESVKQGRKAHGIEGPINFIPLDEAWYSVVKHIEEIESGLLGFILNGLISRIPR